MTLSDAPFADLAPLYDRIAPHYDALHRRWLKHAGGEAQSALEAAVRAYASPDARLLDAGCGTGEFARRLTQEGFASESLTLLDPSDAMLERCADIPCYKVRGRLEAMPFGEDAFDILTCAWALETVTDPEQAISEMRRVLRPGGLLCLAFCAKRPPRGAFDWIIRQTMTLRGTGRFLSVAQVTEAIQSEDGWQTVTVPMTGPVAMMIARRSRS